MEAFGKDTTLGRQTFVHKIMQAGDWEIPPFQGGDYACLLVLGGLSDSDEMRSQVARDLIATRCRYCVYWGQNWDAWLDKVLLANREMPEYDSDHEILLMENWHDPDDALDDVLYTFFSMCDYDAIRIVNFLILFVGVNDDERLAIMDAMKLRLKAQWRFAAPPDGFSGRGW